MGVHGLTPFLARHCPNVLKEIPTRLKAIQGKKVVIDATLLTQRFHFARVPFQNRHVLGWYRLITDLKANDIGVICVFDGKERNAAKMRELQRRREGRAVTLARSVMERDRLKRLKSLQNVVTQIRKLPPENQAVISKELKKRLEATLPIPAVNPELQEEDQYTPMGTNSKPELSSERDVGSTSSEFIDMPKDKQESVKKVTQMLLRRYKKYAQSISGFTKLQIPTPVPLTSTSSVITTAEKLEADPEFNVSASRHQYQLATQEGEAWNMLATGKEDLLEQAEGGFVDLQERSQVLVDSYERRTEFPTDRTYEDAKTLLTAMGVPCIQSEAPFEGEGLASAIVLAGYADFVVSEDTDVIVYGAPMLRGMTDKTRPLMEIVGSEVQEALDLAHDSFVDFALLLGTDFTTRIRLVGPNRALKFIKSHGSIEEIVKVETRYPPSFEVEDYLEQVSLGREIFKSLPKVPSPEMLKQTEPDEERVRAVIDDYGLSRAMLVEEGDFFNVAFTNHYFDDNPHQD